jgi:renalase
MSEKNSIQTCLIVGGGISGLTASTILEQHGRHVTVLDKGHGIGGRLATRRIEDKTFGTGVFDYGAQYCTARTQIFKDYIARWNEAEIIRPWSHGFWTENGRFKHTSIPQYTGITGMRSIAKYLARNLDVHIKTRIVSISWSERRWEVFTETGEIFQGDILALTPPVPQSLGLLQNSDVLIPADTRKRLEKISYHRCIAMLVLLKQPSKIPDPGGMWLSGEPLSWMADNHKKGISPHGFAVTIHAGPEFSRTNWDLPDQELAEKLLDSASQWLGTDIAHYQIHRWRYSQAIQGFEEPYAFFDDPGPCILFGDAFGGNRVEGAFLSGISAANHLISFMDSKN